MRSATPGSFPLQALSRELVASLFSVIFPSTCALCHEHDDVSRGGVCSACWRAMAPWEGSACPGCGLPLPAAAGEAPARCFACRHGRYDFDWARSYGLYAGPLRAAILQLKFYGRESWGRRLGAFLASLWDSPAVAESGRPSVVVPVPLHPARERERGFNQAEILCRGFLAALRRAQRQHLPQLETGCLRRLRATQTQSGLSFEKRLENVRGAFGVEAGDRLRGRAVLLVDDVMTTGATVSACAGVLKRAQAARVVVFTVARATPQVPAGLGAVGIDPVWPHGPVPLPDGQDRL